MTYCGMYAGPGGALGLCAGSVASQALNAGRYPGRIRLAANRSASALPGREGGEPRVERRRVERPGHDPLDVGAVGLRARSRRLGERHRGLRAPLGRRVARSTRRGQPPATAAPLRRSTATDRGGGPPCSAAACFLCSAISLPTSAGDRPSGTAHPRRLPPPRTRPPRVPATEPRSPHGPRRYERQPDRASPEPGDDQEVHEATQISERPSASR